jgi:hypothetical protein
MENQVTFKKGLFSKENVAAKSATQENENSGDGILRIDLKKADGDYIIEGRLLPNLKRTGELGDNLVKRITHFVNVEQGSPLNGYYDSPRNFDPKALCRIGGLQYQLKNSQNILDKEKASKISWSQKWYSYFLVYKDKYAPENNGKIFILQYGKQILNKIQDEEKGQNESDTPCIVFDVAEGKNLRLVVYEKETKNETTGKVEKYPDYTKSFFKSTPSPLTIIKTVDDEDGNPIKKQVQLKLNSEGVLSDKDEEAVFNFLLSRTCDLDKFEPKELTDIQEQNIDKIISLFTGKGGATNNSADATDLFESASGSSNVNDDFDFDEDEDNVETVVETKKTAAPKKAAAPKKEAIKATEEVKDEASDDDDFDF